MEWNNSVGRDLHWSSSPTTYEILGKPSAWMGQCFASERRGVTSADLRLPRGMDTAVRTWAGWVLGTGAGPQAVTATRCPSPGGAGLVPWQLVEERREPGQRLLLGWREGPILLQFFCLHPSYLPSRRNGNKPGFPSQCCPSFPFSVAGATQPWPLVLRMATFGATGSSEEPAAGSADFRFAVAEGYVWSWGLTAAHAPKVVHRGGMNLSLMWILREKSDASAKLGFRACNWVLRRQNRLTVMARSVKPESLPASACGDRNARILREYHNHQTALPPVQRSRTLRCRTHWGAAVPSLWPLSERTEASAPALSLYDELEKALDSDAFEITLGLTLVYFSQQFPFVYCDI